MCYNIAFLTRRLQIYADRYKDTLPPVFSTTLQEDHYLPQYHFVSGFEHPELPVVTGSEILFCQWGLIPHWIRDGKAAQDIRTRTLNAAGETLLEKPSFRKSIASKRCLLGIDGFYEWRLFNKTKYPHFIHSRDTGILSLGCLYDTWTNQATGEMIHTFSVITTPANPLMETIHNTKKRMPLVISRENESRWVSPELKADDVMEMVRPCADDVLEAYTISMAANQVRNDRNNPRIMQRVEYPELTLFG